jgi:methionine synthase II (cobalamin-independent)
MAFNPKFLTTQIGSMPYPDGKAICERLVSTLDIPAWPQLPRRTFHENMYVQYSSALPCISLDEDKEKILFNTENDITPALEEFYSHYLAEDVDCFGLRPDYAAGFYTMLDTLRKSPGEWAKGQVTGPISFGLTVTDQNLRASLYDDMLADVIVKNMAMIARWQVRQLRSTRPNVIIFVDEPYLASFGSAYISLSREQVITILDEVFAGIHAEGALAGVHCCANTDWSVLLATQVDILNLDAFGYLENLSLYASELREFIDRGGCVAWGIVPTGQEIFEVDGPGLAKRLRDGLETISQKSRARGVSINPDEFATHSLISPSCGLGSTTIETTERVLETLVRTGEILKKG